MRISALPGTRFSCAATSWSNLAIRAFDLVWRALAPCRIHSSSSLIAFWRPRFLALLLLEPLGLLLEVGRVIALVREVFPAIELEDPAHHIVEEVAVVGDHQHRAGIFLEMAFQPLDALGVEVVGRLVEQQDRRLLDQQPGQRDAALLAARKIVDRPVGRRAAQRLHRDFELVVERPAVDRVDLALELAHLLHQRVEIGVVLGIAHLGRDGVEAIDHVGDFARAVLDVLEHVLASDRAAAPAADSRR